MAAPIRRRWQHPALTALCLAALITLTLTAHPDSAVGQSVSRLRWGLTLVHPYRAEVFFIRHEDGWRLVDPSIESFDELGSVMTGSEPLIHAHATLHSSSSGIWAVAAASRTWTISIENWSSELAPHEHDQLTDTFAEHERSRNGWDIRQDTRTLRWSGIARDALGIAALIVGCASLGWITRIPRAVNAGRARRALRLRRCLTCRYHLGDLDACPECGRARADTERLAEIDQQG